MVKMVVEQKNSQKEKKEKKQSLNLEFDLSRIYQCAGIGRIIRYNSMCLIHFIWI